MANEKWLIDAEAIARKLKKAHCAECNVVRQIQCSACWVGDVLELLEGDAVDAVEVVHGRCNWCNGDYHTKIMATAIRYHTNGNVDGYELKVNYCPNCGAKMDGDGNG